MPVAHTQPTHGAIRAAKEEIAEVLGEYVSVTDTFTPEYLLLAKRAYEHLEEAETHSAEMLAFIEKVAEWGFSSQGWKLKDDEIIKAQKEAFELIKKVRGE